MEKVSLVLGSYFAMVTVARSQEHSAMFSLWQLVILVFVTFEKIGDTLILVVCVRYTFKVARVLLLMFTPE